MARCKSFGQFLKIGKQTTGYLSVITKMSSEGELKGEGKWGSMYTNIGKTYIEFAHSKLIYILYNGGGEGW